MDVSAEALRDIKKALKVFKSDMEGIGSAAILKEQSCLEEGQRKITETEAKVQELENKTAQLIKRIRELEQKIVSEKKEVQRFEGMEAELKRRLESMHAQLERLSEQLSVLRRTLANAKDNNEQQRIQEQISITQGQINMTQNSIRNMRCQMEQNEEQKNNLQKSIHKHSRQKSENEEVLSETQKKRNQYQKKLGNLKNASKNLHADFSSYIQAVKKFESDSVESADSKYRTIDECINLIEEMESVL